MQRIIWLMKNLSWWCDSFQTIQTKTSINRKSTPSLNSPLEDLVLRSLWARAHQVRVSHGSLLGSRVSAGSICSPWKRQGPQGSDAGPGHHWDCKHEVYQDRAADSQPTRRSPSATRPAKVQSEELCQSPLVTFSCVSLVVKFCYYFRASFWFRRMPVCHKTKPNKLD